MSSGQDNRITKIRDQKAKIENENSLIQQKIESFQSENKKALDGLSNDLSQSKKPIFTEVDSLISSIEKFNKELDEYKKKTLITDRVELKNRLSDILGQITDSSKNLQKRIVDLSTKQEEDVTAIYSQMAGKVNAGLSDIYTTQRKRISEFETTISTKLGEIGRNIVSTVEKESSNQQKMTGNIATSFMKSLDDFSAKIKDMCDSKETNVDTIFMGTVNDSVGRLEIAKEDLLASIDGVMNRLEESLAGQKAVNDEMQEAIHKAIIEAKEDVKNRIENQRLESINNWKTVQEEQVKGLSSIKENASEKFKNSLETNVDLQDKLLSKLEHQFKTNLYDEIDNISLSFTKFQDAFIHQIDSLISRLTSTRDEMKGSLESLLIGNLNKIGNIGKQLEEQLSEVFSEVSNEYEKSREGTYSNLVSTIEDRFNEISTSLEQYGETTAVNLKNNAEDLDVSLMDFFDNTQTNVSETISKNSSTLDQLKTSVNELLKTLQSGQNRNIETTLSDIRNALRTKQSELITTISSISPAADDHVEANREFVKEQQSEISKTSTAAFDGLKDQIAAIEKEGVSSIKTIIGDTNHKLDENVKESERRTIELIEGLEDKHKTSIAKFRAKSSQDVNKNLETLDEYREEIKEKFNLFFDSQQKSLDIVLDINRLRYDALNDHRRNLNMKFEEVGSNIDSAADTLTNSINTNTEKVSKSVNKIVKDVDGVIKAIK